LGEGVSKKFTIVAKDELTNVCGNGTKESGEQCDDGNTNDGDGCTNMCQINVRKIGGYVMDCSKADIQSWGCDVCLGSTVEKGTRMIPNIRINTPNNQNITLNQETSTIQSIGFQNTSLNHEGNIKRLFTLNSGG
jgi:cysteine-rich repeat protein